MRARLLFVVNDAEFFLSHRLPIALAAKAAGYQVHVATPSSNGVDAIRRHGLVHEALPLRRSGTNPLVEILTFLALVRLLRRIKPQIVHLVTIKPVLYGGIAARIAGTPCVVAAISGLGYLFIQESAKARLMRRVVGVFYRMALGHANLRVIFQNPDDKEKVMRLAGLAEHRTVMIRGSGVDLASYVVTPLPKDPVVMLAARMLVDKGVREFMLAARLLRQRGSRARLVLVGPVDANNPASLAPAQIADAVAEGIVEWWGHRADMPQVLAQARVVVLPSYREGLPKILLEAAACGRAVVTTDVPGCRDAITPGVTGLLVAPRSAEELASAIERLTDDSSLCDSMGRAGRQLAESAFDIDAVVASHMRIYEQLAATR